MSALAILEESSDATERTRLGLISTWQDCHWCYNEAFLEFTGLEREKFESSVKTWWGDRQLWLDMLATQIAKTWGCRLGLDQDLGIKWYEVADEWMDQAFIEATAAVTTPPSKAILVSKSVPLAAPLLGGLRPTKATALARTTCDFCGASFAQRLEQCPSCLPRKPVLSASDKERDAEARAASWQRLSPAPFEETMSWEEATELKWCQGGSGGVFVLKVPQGAVCLRGAQLSPGELFAQLLATALAVRTAGLRVVGPHQDEIVSIRGGLQSASAEEDAGIKRIFVAYFDSIAVMEYVDGVPMMGMPAHEQLSAARGESPLWTQLGRLMAFDMLINNFDRLPLVWSNEGNFGNVMLGSRLGPVIGIDQSVNLINHPAGLTAYLQRVRKAHEGARDGQASTFAPVKNAIRDNTGIDLDDVEIRRLCEGCVDLFSEVSRLAKSEDFERTLAAISLTVDRSFIAPDAGAKAAQYCGFVRKVVAAVGVTHESDN